MSRQALLCTAIVQFQIDVMDFGKIRELILNDVHFDSPTLSPARHAWRHDVMKWRYYVIR